MSRQAAQQDHWTGWVKPLGDRAEVASSARLTPACLHGLRRDPPEVACARLRTAWKSIYLPDDDRVDLLVRHIERAMAFARTRYPSQSQYLHERYEGIAPLNEEDRPDVWCVTGLAGASKTETMAALGRLLQPQGVQAAEGFGVVIQPRPVQHLKIEARQSLEQVLASIANPLFLAERRRLTVKELRDHLKDWLHAQFTLLIVLDEIQFLTRSDTASTQSVNLIAELSALGPPLTYISNFSLCHKLMGRKQEEKDRLLAHPIVLQPPVDGPHWRDVVAAYIAVAPEVFGIQAHECAAELHRLTAGLYRMLRRLLEQACRLVLVEGGSNQVTMAHVRAAYGSQTFSSARGDVEALVKMRTSSSSELRRRHKDLVSPFDELVSPTAPAPKAFSFVADSEEVAQRMLRGAIDAGGQATLRQLRAAVQEVDAGVRPKAVVTPHPRKPQVTAESLLAGAKRTMELKPTRDKVADVARPEERE